MKVTDKIEVFNCDNIELLKQTHDNSIDIICIDPPYLYLKNQKLEKEFDFDLFFSECKRVLTENGSIIIFGRGVSFWEMNLKIHELGFKFKEEVIWDKNMNTSAVLALGRRHECVSIFQLGQSKINSVKVDIFKKYEFEPHKIIRMIERISSAIGNNKSLALLKKYFEKGHLEYAKSKQSGYNTSRAKSSNINMDRSVVSARALNEGTKEQSIIQVGRDHYSTVHPTQKPVDLIERLINLVIPQDKEIEEVVVADFFGGSYSTMRAVYKIGCKGIACEFFKDYHEAGVKETLIYISNNSKQLKMF